MSETTCNDTISDSKLLATMPGHLHISRVHTAVNFFFLFCGFRRPRFGSFCGCGFAWLGHETCWGSGFSHALPKHFFLKFCLVACRLPSLSLRKVAFLAGGNLFSFFLVGSVGNVSAGFVAAVSHGLGTQPAGVRAFRMRSPSTFFLSFAWWLAGFQVFRCTKLTSLLEAIFFLSF